MGDGFRLGRQTSVALSWIQKNATIHVRCCVKGISGNGNGMCQVLRQGKEAMGTCKEALRSSLCQVWKDGIHPSEVESPGKETDVLAKGAQNTVRTGGKLDWRLLTSVTCDEINTFASRMVETEGE